MKVKFILKNLYIILLSFLLFSESQAKDDWELINQSGELRWGADANGGAPYVFPDPDNPSDMIGFEIDIITAISKQLKLKPRLVIVPWDQLVPALLRKDFDLAFNGLEITKDRQESIDFTIPYYFFSEQITVRQEDSRFVKFEDFRGYKIGTLSASLAQNILEKDGQITVVPYPTPVEAYKDLEIGRIDGVLLDVPIAVWYATPNPKLKNIGEPVGEGIYAGGIRKNSPILKSKINYALSKIIKSGELEKIYKKWNMWTKNQKKLKIYVEKELKIDREKSSLKKYIPLILKGAGMTVILSFLSMSLAIVFGFALCMGKLYGNSILKALCKTYIEIIRGTPLLIQLYLLYYGLPNIGIQLNAFVAAVLGMGLNYSAYEAEIYRAGLLSVPKGQDEAARSLGLTGKQSLWYIILPQAFRTILPPSTNDFIALFKDTSLVSIITVTELTRAYSQAATTTFRFLELGLITAFLYFIMSFPLSLWSGAMEAKRHVTMH